MKRKTTLGIDGDAFRINGRLTYEGRTCRGMRVEGLLLNSRMVQGIFDDLNPETRGLWAYPDGPWDPGRNTQGFLDVMPQWRKHGLLSFTINLQGGSPQGYSKGHPWHNSAFKADGELRPDYLARLERILDRADVLGMAPIVGLFYFGQDERLEDEGAIIRAVEHATDWLLEKGYANVMVEIANECDHWAYEHAVLRPPRVCELIELLQRRGDSHCSIPSLRSMTCCLASTSRISRWWAAVSFRTSIPSATDSLLLRTDLPRYMTNPRCARRRVAGPLGGSANRSSGRHRPSRCGI